MKRIILSFAIILFSLYSKAQTISLTLVSAACDTFATVATSTTGLYLPITYTWTTASGTVVHSHVYSVTDTLSHVPPGAVTIVALDTTGITDSTSFNVSSVFVTDVSPTPAVCPGLGSIEGVIGGGVPPFTVSCTGAAGTYTGVTTSPGSWVNIPVPVGAYTVIATDSGGCSYTFGTYNVGTAAAFYQYDTDNIACPATSGSVGLVLVGLAIAPITYQWENASGAIVATTNPATLPVGLYTVTVTDSTGCSFVKEDTVSSIPDFTIDSINSTPAVCPALGSLSALITGGTAPFIYQWVNTATSTVAGTTNPVSVPAGSYLLTVTDALGCSYTNPYPVSPWITPDFTTTVTTTNANCTNGTASVAMTGGSAPFSYLWSTGATTASISGLVSAPYNVTVTDALGCTSGGLHVFVNQGITIADTPVTTPATCLDDNGTAIAFPSGGTPPYTYLWSNGATTQSISGLAANYYIITATDANGCIGSTGVYVGTSTPIYVTYTATSSLCTSNTGTASLVISGGTAPYSVVWYTTPVQTTTTATGLGVGNYYFVVTDAVGCTQNGWATVPPVDPISLVFTATPADCLAADGSITVTPVGGVAPFTYAWAGLSATTAAVNSITSAYYTATVTDVNGCSATCYGYVPFNSPLVLGVSTSPATCLYNHDGVIEETASMGTPPYNYSLGGSTSGSVTIDTMATGNYWLYVTDAMGCSAWQYTNVGYNAYDSSCFCTLQGKVFYDSLRNCIPGNNPGIDNIQLQCTGFGYTYSNDTGYYDFLLPLGTYTLSQTVLAFYPLSPCQTNDFVITSTPSSSTCYITQNFGDTIDPIHDMRINTWDYMFAVPGHSYTHATVVTNLGTGTENNILASYNPDGQILTPSFVPSGIFGGSAYNYTTAGMSYSLTPGSSTEFLMTYNVPTSIPLGTNVIFKDTIAYQAPMSNWLLDYSPWNNVDYFTTRIVASYDPNFKEVSPQGTGPLGYITYADSELTYMIHFQNTGTFMAQNITVLDTLDPNLNWKTLRPTFTSGACKVTMDDQGRVAFTFTDIDLPPAQSEPIASNGMLSYTIKTKPGLPIGTQFKNRASIYFDYNAPVMTNTTLNTLWFPASVNNVQPVEKSTFTIYPNPADDQCYASVNSEVAGSAEIRVIDITGKTMLHQDITLKAGMQNIPIDVTNLVPGMYYVSIFGNGFNQTQKFVILKQ